VFSGTWKETSEVGHALSAVVSNLEPLTKYEVQVAAYTSVGESSWETRSATTIEKPGLYMI